jgi:DNA polymerase (family 10)
MSLNHELSDLFRTFAAIMEIKGESVFKSIAFSKVSRILKDMTIDLRDAVEKGTLKGIEGIGASSQKIIEDYVRTGTSKDFQDVAASVPAGLLPMLDIPGMGPKTIALLWKERGITSIDQLLKAIDDGKLEGVKGLGDKKIASIKEGIAMRETAAQRKGIADVLPIADELVARLRKLKQVKDVQVAGSLRRRKETIGDVDLICTLKDGADGDEVSAEFVKFPQVAKINVQGTTKASIVTTDGLQVDLRMVPADSFGAAMMYFTGSKDHNVKLRGRAIDQGYTLNEWGLYKLKEYDKAKKETGRPPTIKPVAGKTEQEVYKKLGLEFIEPELREDRGEIDLSEKGKLPKLVSVEDIRGDLHTHTTASDGAATIQQMAEAAAARGYEYLAITDHSKSQVIANGLTAERLLKHVAEIRKASGKYGVKLLAGCEVDILADGHMDFEDAVLKELDFVVGSPHVALKQDETKATDRILRAIENRWVCVIGHPTGRLINQRAGLPLNFPKIYQAAKDTGTALEINAGWPRLDLNDVNARGALEAGVMLTIDTDAHSTEGLSEIGLGIATARRAAATAKQVLNCQGYKDVLAFVAKKRR